MDPTEKEAFAAVVIFCVGFLFVLSSLVLLLYQLWNLFFPRPRLLHGHLAGLKGIYILQRPILGAGALSRPGLVYKHLEKLRESENLGVLITLGVYFLYYIAIIALMILAKTTTNQWIRLLITLIVFALIIFGQMIVAYVRQLFNRLRSRKRGTDAMGDSPLEPPKATADEGAERAAAADEMQLFRFIPKRLLGALEVKNVRFSIDFQGAFVVHGSAVLAAGNEERGLFYDPGGLRDFCVFMGSKLAFISAVLGTSLGFLAFLGFWRGVFQGVFRGSLDWAVLGPSLLPYPALALIFWFCLGWLRLARLSRALRPLIGELSRQPYYELHYGQARGESAFEWKTLAAVVGLVFSIWLTWRLLAGF